MLITSKINTLLRSKFTLLLFGIIIFIILAPYAETFAIFKFFLLIITVVVFLGVLLALPPNPRTLLFFACFAIITIVCNFAYSFFNNNSFKAINALCFLIFYGSAIIIFTRDILSKKIVTHDIVIGSVCIYLLLGITFAYLYSFIEAIKPGSFAVVASGRPPTNFELFYFSYITITTLGYGDIVSTSLYSKSFVMLESVTGVLYIAVLVARLVSVLNKRRI